MWITGHITTGISWMAFSDHWLLGGSLGFHDLRPNSNHLSEAFMNSCNYIQKGVNKTYTTTNSIIMSQIYSKDSLDRFGDDLCQHLLSYLSFEDRFTYECLSKQWQRVGYPKCGNYGNYSFVFKTDPKMRLEISGDLFDSDIVLPNDLFIDFKRLTHLTIGFPINEHFATKHFIHSSTTVHKHRIGCPVLVYISMDDVVANPCNTMAFVEEFRQMGKCLKSMRKTLWTDLVTICVNMCCLSYHLKTGSDLNVCPNSGREWYSIHKHDSN
ncbi:unnamed protein product [Oppiella nova]|uniref:Uncharacterized protein n=1 Tax=Oppiella nova TaxID=334625 RepID=A0A7R9QIJ6_9ACAR|nr:unnamed protein product [Oppiella nova]CAG2166439.1 unnamed protein product [Oppiella nova]